jgi:hypothetical protein
MLPPLLPRTLLRMNTVLLNRSLLVLVLLHPPLLLVVSRTWPWQLKSLQGAPLRHWDKWDRPFRQRLSVERAEGTCVREGVHR